jgi:hypothetical protein
MPLALAVTALACAWALDGWLVPDWQEQTDLFQQQALALQRQLRDTQQAARAVQRPVDAPDVAWPSEGSVNARMADLLALAVRNGVMVQRVQRVGIDGAKDGTARTTLAMPVRAAYADLRNLLSQALQQDGALALERISLRRTKEDATELEGELQWVLYHRRSGASAP